MSEEKTKQLGSSSQVELFWFVELKWPGVESSRVELRVRECVSKGDGVCDVYNVFYPCAENEHEQVDHPNEDPVKHGGRCVRGGKGVE